MTQPRLPDGFAVQVDRRVRVLRHGAALLGGSPTRLLRLAPAARTMLGNGRVEVHDAQSAQLAAPCWTPPSPTPAIRRTVAPRCDGRYSGARQPVRGPASDVGAARPAGHRGRRRLGKPAE